MKRTIRATFDGEVFRPEEPVDLSPDAECLITVESAASGAVENRPLLKYVALAEHLGVTDLAENHDRYLYGADRS